jgi:DNA-binding winged helix-turn-helix (wHTH) protein
MIYRFGPFELDTAKVELRSGGEVCSVEPQVFALLALLVDNRERLVSKNEIIEKVWDGRVVSEAAVASRIKSARKVLGDDGKTQQFIKTIHGQGFRFVAGAKVSRAVVADQGGGKPAVQSGDHTSRPSIAVLPFRPIGATGLYAAIADALPHELITELSRL